MNKIVLHRCQRSLVDKACKGVMFVCDELKITWCIYQDMYNFCDALGIRIKSHVVLFVLAEDSAKQAVCRVQCHRGWRTMCLSSELVFIMSGCPYRYQQIFSLLCWFEAFPLSVLITVNFSFSCYSLSVRSFSPPFLWSLILWKKSTADVKLKALLFFFFFKAVLF